MSGRPRSFDEEQALEGAMQCFWTHGYRATSLQTLLRATGLSKSSLYGSFGDKDRMFVRCLTHYRRELVAALEDRLVKADSGRDFVEQVLEIVALEAEEPEPRGCLVMNSVNELGGSVPTLSSEVSHCVANVTRVFRRAMVMSQTDGSIGCVRDAGDLARYLVAHIGGVRNLIKGGAADPDQVRRLNAIVLEALA